MNDINIENNNVKKVGKLYENSKRAFCYIDIEANKKEWIDASKFLPSDFDLCHCRTKNKIVPGWYTGFCWDGLQIKPDDEILEWKLNYDL